DGSSFPARGAPTPTGQTYQVGQIVTITNSANSTQRFEFTRTGVVGAGNFDVLINAGDTPEQIAAKLANRIDTLLIGGNRFLDSATSNGTIVTLRGERTIAVSMPDVGMAIHGRTIFVDNRAPANADGSLERPFNNIAGTGTNAFSNTHPGDVVRIVGNGG